MLLTQEDYETIEDLAACNYAPRKIAMYLSLDLTDFMSAWYDRKSKVRFHYNKGQLQADFEIAQKRLENAKKGNLTADQQHSKEREARRVEDVKNEILFCGATLKNESNV